MRWQSEWTALSARLDALGEVAAVFTNTNAEWHGASDIVLVPGLKDLGEDLGKFLDRFGGSLPTRTRDDLASHLAKHKQPFQREGKGVSGMQGAAYLLGILISIRAAVNYTLTDTELVARRLVDRAFIHLGRSLVADRYLSARWRRAFADGEPACERLGASHLLSHGLWAFKADAKGGRTDLILGGPVPVGDATRAADALILTEWKLVREGDKADAKLNEAIAQAEIYTEEILWGFEVETRRYAVLVGQGDLSGLRSLTESKGKVYQTVTLSISPPNPSERSRKAARG